MKTVHDRTARVAGLAAALSLLIALAAPAAVAAADQSHSLIRFWLQTEADQQIFAENQARWDVVAGRAGRFADIVVPRDEQADWLALGSRVEVLQDDLEAFYAQRNGTRDNFGLYHTYDEGVAWLDSISAELSRGHQRQVVAGLEHRGPQHLVRARLATIPSCDEPEEPEILFDALHHAREVMTSEMVLMLTEYLAEQYEAGDPEITALLDENAVYMVPWSTPTATSTTSRPTPTAAACGARTGATTATAPIGVDLNRNYPYEWGCDNGSSGNPSDETYRGPSPGSEPETQAMMQFINAHDFVIRQSFHTYGDLTLYPWGYTTADTPDHATFVRDGRGHGPVQRLHARAAGRGALRRVRRHLRLGLRPAGRAHQDLRLHQRDRQHDGFWPADAERQALFDENLWPSLYLIATAGDLRGPPSPTSRCPSRRRYAGPQPVDGGDRRASAVRTSTPAAWCCAGAWTAALGTSSRWRPPAIRASSPARSPRFPATACRWSTTSRPATSSATPAPRPAALPTRSSPTRSPASSTTPWRPTAAGAPARPTTTRPADSGCASIRWAPPTTAPVQPEDDHTAAGTQAWITGQHVAGEAAGFNDVDGGKTTLLSPVYDLAGGQNVAVRYWRWYTNDAGNNPGEDWWDVEISNDGGATWTAVEHTQASDANWLEQQFLLADYFTAPGQVQLRFVAGDEGGGSLVEAGVDDFLLVGDFGGPLGVDDGAVPDALTVDLSASPNPFNPLTTLRFRLPAAGATQVGVFDLHGRLIKSLVRDDLPAGDHAVTWNGRDALGRPVASGVYFVRLLTPDGDELHRKLLLAK